MKRKVFFMVVMLMQINVLFAQTSITANAKITSSTEVASIKPADLYSKTVYASGQAEFTSNSGYVRILLSDNYGYDLLIYESSPLVATNGVDDFNSQAFESVKIPANIDLTKIRVEISNATLKNLALNISTNAPSIQKSVMIPARADL